MGRTSGVRAFLPAMLVLVVAIGAAGCKKEPPKPPPFSAAETATRIAGVALDDAFFQGLEALKTHAATDPAAAAAYGRLALDALAVTAATGAPATRLIGADLKDGAAVARFLNGVAAVDKTVAPAATALASAAGGGGDLTAALAVAAGDGPGAPALRLYLARRYLGGLKAAADTPESERGQALQAAIPGLPTAPASTPMGTALPTALQTLSKLLAQGAGAEAALAPHFQKVAGDAEASLGPRAFPVSLTPDPNARPAGAPGVGARGAYQPLAVLGVGPESLALGTRPVLAWQGGKPQDLTAAIALPGKPVADGGQLAKGGDEVVKTLKAAAEEVGRVADPAEAKAWAALAGKGVLAADRKDRPRPVLVSLDGATPAPKVRNALAAAVEAGLGELRLLPPGVVGPVLPAFFRKLPAVEGVENPKGPRLLVVLTPTAAELYAPGKAGAGLPLTGWPEGAVVGKDKDGGKDKFFKLTVPWAAEKGFGLVLTKAAAELSRRASLAPLADVVVRSNDVTAAQLLDTAAELAAAGDAPFPGLEAWFPGLACPGNVACVAVLPILYSDAAVPKPAKPESTVKEDTRPAGFCEQAAVKRVILGRSGAIRACYEIELQRRANLEGRLEVRFTIEPNGSVSGVRSTVNELNPAVEACVLRQLSGLRFPQPDGGVCVIRWPFKFQPGG